jgi:DegV family protein with EDD domain
MDHAVTESASMEEYEVFFAEALVEAENVIHISMAEGFGKSYEAAVAAAQGFDHVCVIDSEQISGAEGLVALYAAKLAKERYNYRDILEQVGRLKKRVKGSFIMPDANAFYRNGHTNRVNAMLCQKLHLHPVITVRQSEIRIQGFRVGSQTLAWRSYFRWYLARKREIDTAVVFITYIGCTVRQVNEIKQEVLRLIPFEQVIVQRGSCCSACNSGIGTVGLAYYLRE